jgi:hypothetical protein
VRRCPFHLDVFRCHGLCVPRWNQNAKRLGRNRRHSLYHTRP